MEGLDINSLLSAGVSPSLLSELSTYLHVAKVKVSDMLLQGKVKCPQHASKLSSVITNLQQRWTDDYQERQYLQMKKEKEALETRLQKLHSTLQVLQPLTHSEEPQRKRRNSSTKRDLSLEQVKKTMESQEFVRNMKKRKRTEYSRIYQQIQQEIQTRSAVSESQELERKEEAARKLREFHTQERLKMSEKTLQHKTEREAFKAASTSLPKIWRRQKAIPESVSFTPPNRSSIKDKFSISDLRSHERKYATFLISEEAKRHQTMASRIHDMQVQSALLPKPQAALSEEATPTRTDVLKLLTDKRRRYGNIVRELFRPSVDTQKREEMERKIEEMRNPRTKKRGNMGKGQVSVGSEERQVHPDSAELDTQVSAPVPKRVKTVKSKSIKAKKEEVKYRNYLETLKRERTESAISRLRETPDFSNRFDQLALHSSDQATDVLAEADRLVHRVHRCEAALKALPVTHPKALATEYSMNEVLMTAVKAKLALLQSSISN